MDPEAFLACVRAKRRAFACVLRTAGIQRAAPMSARFTAESGQLSGRRKSTNRITRGSAVSFHTSCSKVSSKTRLPPSSQRRCSWPTRISQRPGPRGTIRPR